MTTGIIFNIQRFSLHDGPGIRTTVFAKGCTLRCIWCHNPEAISPHLETGAHGQVFGQPMTAAEVLLIVEKDRRYYDTSGGGLTLSGGEPLFQFAFARELLSRAKASGLHTALDTAGNVPRGWVAEILPFVDLFLYDIKAHTPDVHRRLTGAPNTRILNNLDYLVEHGAAVRLRCPLIPGINDSVDHLRFIAALSRRFPQLDGIDLMPFHDLAAGKWRAVGRTWQLDEIKSAAPDQQAAWLNVLRAEGCDRARIG